MRIHILIILAIIDLKLYLTNVVTSETVVIKTLQPWDVIDNLFVQDCAATYCGTAEKL